MKFIVGLGNPGRRYRSTPHNIGYHVADALAERNRLKWSPARKIDGEMASGEIAGTPCLLLKPATYMNLSGEAVAPIIKMEPLQVQSDLLVIYDDADLPFGRLRVKPKGSAGGHKGILSIISHLGTQEFSRLRCGINPGEKVEDLAGYVLASWPRSLWPEVEKIIQKAADAAEKWIISDIDAVMNQFNMRDS